MEKRWSKAEIAHLKRSVEKQSAEELAQRFRTDTETVRRKLEELGLGSADADARAADTALEEFQQAFELLNAKKWAPAAKLFDKVATSAEGLQLADRARQYLAICQSRTAKEDDGADPYLRAVFEKNKGNLEAALELCQKHGSLKKEERYAYLAASIQALSGATDEALKLLEAAIKLEPKNRVHAYHDPDFEALQASKEFAQLVQAP